MNINIVYEIPRPRLYRSLITFFDPVFLYIVAESKTCSTGLNAWNKRLNILNILNNINLFYFYRFSVGEFYKAIFPSI